VRTPTLPAGTILTVAKYRIRSRIAAAPMPKRTGVWGHC